MNILSEAIKAIGGYEATGRVCGVSGKAVMKWERKGRLPRTEWTGETDYATKIALATGNKYSRDDILIIPAKGDPPVRISGNGA